jgi:hypothetical protein
MRGGFGKGLRGEQRRVDAAGAPCGLELSRRHAPTHRQVGEKRADLHLIHLARVPLAVEQDEPLDPAQVGILGAQAVVPHPNRVAHLRQERKAALSMDHVTNPPWLDRCCAYNEHRSRKPRATLIIRRGPGYAATRARTGFAAPRRLRFCAGQERGRAAMRVIRKGAGIARRPACVKTTGKAVTGCASDCSSITSGRAAALSRLCSPSQEPTGYAELFRV